MATEMDLYWFTCAIIVFFGACVVRELANIMMAVHDKVILPLAIAICRGTFFIYLAVGVYMGWIDVSGLLR